MNLKKSTIQNILLFSVSMIFAFAFVEIFLQWGQLLPPFYNIKIDAPNRVGKYQLSSNPELIYLPKSDWGEYNSLGFKGTHYTTKKNRTKQRVVFVGDSVADGINVSLVKRYSHLVDQRLINIEIVNFAVSGYDLIQQVEYLKERGLKMHPDLVVFNFCWNDLRVASGEIIRFSSKYPFTTSQFYRQFQRKYNYLINSIYGLSIYQWILYFTYAQKNKVIVDYKVQENFEITDDELQILVDKVIQMSERYNFKVRFVLLPTLLNVDRPFERIIKVLNANKIKWLDARTVFGKQKKEKIKYFLWNDSIHLNENGHSKISEFFIDNWDQF